MLNNLFTIIASFTRPEDITVNAWTPLWIIPLLITISLVYKTIKLRVILWPKLIRETLVLLVTTSIFMLLIALASWLFIDWAV